MCNNIFVYLIIIIKYFDNNYFILFYFNMYYYNYNNYNTLIHIEFIQFYILEYIINRLPISYKQIILFILEIEESLVKFQKLELLF